jgi:hypothetical protein
MSLLDQPEWDTLAPHIRLQIYDRDGGHRHPRIRIELDTAAPLVVRQLALRIRMPCVACQTEIAPFRARRGKPTRGAGVGAIYFAAACPLRVTYACARGDAAKNEYLAIKSAMEENSILLKAQAILHRREKRARARKAPPDQNPRLPFPFHFPNHNH